MLESQRNIQSLMGDYTILPRPDNVDDLRLDVVTQKIQSIEGRGHIERIILDNGKWLEAKIINDENGHPIPVIMVRE